MDIQYTIRAIWISIIQSRPIQSNM